MPCGVVSSGDEDLPTYGVLCGYTLPDIWLRQLKVFKINLPTGYFSCPPGGCMPSLNTPLCMGDWNQWGKISIELDFIGV